MPLQKERKKTLISEYGKNAKDSGNAEAQIALLTERINTLSSHFEKNIKDHHSRYGLIKMVSRRKKLLIYLNRTDAGLYKKLIARLDLRK